MGKKTKKKARSGLKEKRVSPCPPKTIPLESNPCAEVVVSVEKERKVCVHLEKDVDLVKVSSKIESAECTGCEDCREGAIGRRAYKVKPKLGKKKGVSDSKSESKATWVCLQCGHFSCGGVGLPTTSQSHAVRHARQSRHPLFIQVENPHLRWCFSCSMLIPVDKVEDDTGEQKDFLSDIVLVFKKQSSKGASEDIWFGSRSDVSEQTAENEVTISDGKDYYAVRGLVNLGNTCFFNSVLQNLLAMNMLREHLLNYDGPMGLLTSSLKKIFVETSLKTDLRNVINTEALFGCVCAKAPQFRGYQQQDSHELLRCLLDGLSTEESCAKKSDNSVSESRVPLPISSTFVDDIFGGRLSSTVCCVECGHSSVVHEPFLDLSLPVPTKKPSPKKVQPVSRTRKAKLPPRKGGKACPKLKKVPDSIPDMNHDASTGSENSSGISKAPPSNLVESSNMVDINNSTEQKDTSIQMPNTGAQEVDSLAWLDYLEPLPQNISQECYGTAWVDYAETDPSSKDPNLVTEGEDLPDEHNSGVKGGNDSAVQNSAKSSDEAQVHPANLNMNSESIVDDCAYECPVQVLDNQVLLLTYEENSAIAREGCSINNEMSSSAVGGENSLEFDGLGDLFNEPDVAVPSSSFGNIQANDHLENGYLAPNISESDPDEVDNTDSPVSVESCLAHFVKPELLSSEHAWHCENCSNLLLEERQNIQNNLVKTTKQKNLSCDECSSSQVFQGKDHLSPEYSVWAARINGSTGLIEHTKLDTTQINGPCSLSTEETQEREKSSLLPRTLGCSGPSDEVSSSGSSMESQRLPAGDHDSVKRLSGQSEVRSLGKDEEVDSNNLKVMREATKRILINKAPSVLTIHLKRFSQDTRGRLSKLNGYIGFKEYLDLGSYLDHRSPGNKDYFYQLVGVVEHSGSMRGGHYVAYVRGGRTVNEDDNSVNTHPPIQAQKRRRSVWYYASDAYVSETTLEKVLGCEAYLLFYEKCKA